MPAVMLGFHPSDSCVVMGLSGRTVSFCARLDLDWFVHHFDQVADQIINASAHVPECRFVVIGYGDPDAASLAVAELVAVVGEQRVLEAMVTDGRTTWLFTSDLEPQEIECSTSALEAQAVYEGVRICADREEAVAPVERHEPLPADEVASAEALVTSLSPADAMDLLAELVESDEPLSPTEACTLAVLLEDEDRVAAVLSRLSILTAEVMWLNLLAARTVAPAASEDNVVALLGMASWLNGQGAAQSSCMEQLARSNPQHTVGGLLNRLHREGVPPRRWHH